MPLKLAANEHIVIPEHAGSDCLLAVPYCSQNSFQNLCWAACCKMVLDYNGKNVASLCNITSDVFNQDCCAVPESCDHTCWPNVAYGKLNFQCLEFDHPFDTDALSHEIRQNSRPVQALLEYSGGATHVVLIAGLYADNQLLVLDPIKGRGKCTYQYLYEAYGNGYWIYSYYNLIPN